VCFDHLIIDYSVGDTGSGMTFSSGTSGAYIRRYVSDTGNGWLDELSADSIEQYTVTGTRKNDFFDLRITNNTIKAGAGNDSVRVYSPISGNIVDGGTGTDYLYLELSNQTANLTITNPLSINFTGVVKATNFEQFELRMGSGNDTFLQSGIVNGSVLRADDTFYTYNGNDTVNAGLGIDKVFAGNGTDHLILDYSLGDTGSGMQFNGSSSYGTASRNVSITNSTVLDRIVFTGVERFTVTGTSKADTIYTVSGNDIIKAGAGNDLIRGGAGGDLLTGGLNADTFQYQNYSDSLLSNYDVIKDFEIGIDAIDGPRAVAAAQIKKLGSVTALTEPAIQKVLTSTNFVANGASTFKFNDRTFLALNDASAGFAANRDSMIEITGFTGNLNHLRII